MTTHQKKEYLKSYRRIDVRVKELIEQAQLWSQRVSSFSATFANAKSDVVSDRVSDAAIKMIEMEKRISDEIDGLVKVKEGIEQAIRKIDAKEAEVIYLRYIDGLKWEEISAKMHYDYRYLFRIHQKALEDIEFENV